MSSRENCCSRVVTSPVEQALRMEAARGEGGGNGGEFDIGMIL